MTHLARSFTPTLRRTLGWALAPRLVALFVHGFLFAAAARAQPVVLDLSGCAAPAASEVRALSALELRGRLRDQHAVAQADDERITVLCTGERASLVSAPRGDLRTIDLASVPQPLRARLLALAIAELARAQVIEVSDSIAEPTESPDVEAAAEPPARESAPRVDIVRPAPAWSGMLSAGVELSPAPLLAAAGVLSTLVRVATPLAWTGSLSLGQARRDIEFGRLRVRSLAVRTGPALLLQRSSALLYAGLAARFTLLELRGEPSDDAQLRGARFRSYLLAPAAFAGAVWLFGRLLVALDLELCHQLREVRAQLHETMSKASVTTLSPWRVALGLSLGARW